jgi:hypothetical protein
VSFGQPAASMYPEPTTTLRADGEDGGPMQVSLQYVGYAHEFRMARARVQRRLIAGFHERGVVVVEHGLSEKVLHRRLVS